MAVLINSISIILIVILLLWLSHDLSKAEDRIVILFRKTKTQEHKICMLNKENKALKSINEKTINVLEKLSENYDLLLQYYQANKLTTDNLTDLCKTVKEQIINHNEIFKNQGDLIASCIKLIELQEDGLKDLDDKVATYLSTPRKGAIPIPKELQ